MEEFIFGILANDQLKLLRHRTARRGLQHHHELSPRDPQPGQPILLTVRAGIDLSVEHVYCYYTVDGSQPSGSHGKALTGEAIQLQPNDPQWDTASWGYQVSWSGEIPAQPENTILRYQFSAWTGEGEEIFADWPDVKAAGELGSSAFFGQRPIPSEITVGDPQKPHTFTCSIDRLQPPQWAYDAIIYHIFVDRFFPGQGRTWLQTDDLNGIVGGTLWGVAEKLDYIVDLGVNCIWLSPVFSSPTHHGYDVTDYGHVEPRLGGDEALCHLIEAAHARGLRVILDIALNHISDQHPHFQEAFASPSSVYRSRFTFDDSELGYDAYFGVPTMPRLNASDPEAHRWLIEIGLYWLREYAIDGYRLDVADGSGPDFWPEFWTACKAQNPDCFCFGEVVDAPDVQREYVGRLDGLLNFHLCNALRRTFAESKWSETDFDRFIARHQRYFPRDFLMPSFIDNHDMDRFILLANGNKDALRRASEVLFSLPNPPVIYYGTEIGLTQKDSGRDGFGLHVNRVPMVWGDDQDKEMLAFFKDLIRRRQKK